MAVDEKNGALRDTKPSRFRSLPLSASFPKNSLVFLVRARAGQRAREGRLETSQESAEGNAGIPKQRQ
jgi:hypothetical protein